MAGVAPLIASIFDHFAPLVKIYCDPSAFTFSGRSGTKVLETFLYLERVGQAVKIVSVGSEVAVSSENIFKAEIFGPKPDARIPASITTRDLLLPFLRFGIALITPGLRAFGHRLTIRMKVSFYGHESLDSALEGHAKDWLTQAATGAAARTVTFHDDRS